MGNYDHEAVYEMILFIHYHRKLHAACMDLNNVKETSQLAFLQRQYIINPESDRPDSSF